MLPKISSWLAPVGIALRYTCALVLMCFYAHNTFCGFGVHLPYAQAEEVGMRGPIGWDVFDEKYTPVIPQGVHTYQFASTDPASNNHDSFHCYRVLANGSCELAEAYGAGEIDSIWTTRQGDDLSRTGNLTVILDDKTIIHAKFQDIVNGKLGAPFVFPIVANAHQSSGGSYIIAPMTYHSSMKVITDNDPEYYHVTYRSFDSSVGVETFDPHVAHNDIIHKLLDPSISTHITSEMIPTKANNYTGVIEKNSQFTVPAHSQVRLTHFRHPGVVSLLNIRLPMLTHNDAQEVKDLLSLVNLVVIADGKIRVESPLGEFFGSGYKRLPIKSQMFLMSQGGDDRIISRWPMPFTSTVEIKLVNNSSRNFSGNSAVTAHLCPGVVHEIVAHRMGYFRAYHQQTRNTPGTDFLFFHTYGSGKFVGISGIMQGNSDHKFLEGNEHIFYDYSNRPQINGTGTEDFFEGGWYFDSGNFSNPLNGAQKYRCEDSQFSTSDICIAAYRLFIHDSVTFTSDIAVRIQHGPVNDVDSLYSFTSFWYEAG